MSISSTNLSRPAGQPFMLTASKRNNLPLQRKSNQPVLNSLKPNRDDSAKAQTAKNPIQKMVDRLKAPLDNWMLQRRINESTEALIKDIDDACFASALEVGELDVIDRILKKPELDINKKVMGKTPLERVLFAPHKDITEDNLPRLGTQNPLARLVKLLNAKTNPPLDINTINEDGATALHKSLDSLQGWNDPLATMSLKLAPLREAGVDKKVNRFLEQQVKLLVDAGADTTIRDRFGRTALDLATPKKTLVTKYISDDGEAKTVFDGPRELDLRSLLSPTSDSETKPKK